MKQKSIRLLLCAVMLTPAGVLAEVLSQDTFVAYTVGAELPGQNPTINGYSGAWVDVAFGNAEPAVEAGSLTYAGANYAPGGGDKISKTADMAGIAAENCGRVERLLQPALTATGATTGTIYLSWLFKTGNENVAANADTYQTLALWNGSAANDGARDFEAGIALGDFATPNYGFRVDNNAPSNLNVPRNSDTHLFVAKFVLSSTSLSDSVTVWIDPVLGAGEPTGGVTVSGKDLVWDRLALSDYASNSSAWDDIRWGTTFDSVTTEPIVPAVPQIEAQPVSYNGFVSDSYVLQSGAIASPVPTYQWQKSADGVSGWEDIDGQTGNTLQFFFLQYYDKGFYRLVATNANGSATSDVAEVSVVYPPPQIQTQPTSVSAPTGGTAVFSVVATGIGDVTYQWYKGANLLGGQTADTLTLSNVQSGDEGDYWVRLMDNGATLADGLPATTIDSEVATLDVFDAPSGLFSHDPFSIEAGYVAGELPAQNPAIPGYTGAWADVDFGEAEPAITSGSLVYGDPQYLGSSGDKASVATNITGGEITAANSGRVFRLLDPTVAATSTSEGTVYMSFLFQSGQETGASVYQMLSLFNTSTTDANRNFDIGLTNNGGQTGTAYNFGADNIYTSTGVAADTDVHLLVVKFELSASPFSDRVTVWVDPVLGAGDPSGGTTVTGQDFTWDRLALSDYEGNSAAWDEIRWGTTFNSVTFNGNAASTYGSWIAGFSGANALPGFRDDADGDGIRNGVENFFGTDPSAGNTGISTVAKSADTVTFQHPQSATPASDVTIAYKWSTDLVTYHASGATSAGATVTLTPALNTPSSGTTTVTASITGNQPARLFLVLEASLIP
jgi:Immunoglobulin domain